MKQCCDTSAAPLACHYMVSRHSSQPQTTSWDSGWAEGRSTNYHNTNSLVYRRHHNPLTLLYPRITEHSWVWSKYEICMIQQQDMLFRSFGNSVHPLRSLKPSTASNMHVHIQYNTYPVHPIHHHAIQYTKALFQVKLDH